MTAHDIKPPYMIYEGPRPTPPAPAESAAPDAAQADGSWGEEAERGWGTVFGVGVLVAGTLAAGIAIGVWLAPTLRPADAVASREPTAPLALSVTRPAETPAPAPIEIPPLPRPVAPEQQASVQAGAARAPSTAPARPARVAPSQPIKTAATRPAEAVGGCKASGKRVQMALCADASIAAADQDMRNAFQRAMRITPSPESLRVDQQDWLAFREEAARRSPDDLAEAYRQRVAELNRLGNDPPY